MRATESAPPADLGASEKDLAMPSTKAFEDRYGSSVQGGIVARRRRLLSVLFFFFVCSFGRCVYD